MSGETSMSLTAQGYFQALLRQSQPRDLAGHVSRERGQTAGLSLKKLSARCATSSHVPEGHLPIARRFNAG